MVFEHLGSGDTNPTQVSKIQLCLKRKKEKKKTYYAAQIDIEHYRNEKPNCR